MLSSGKLSNDMIVANSVLFFEAGFETMSAGLAFITYLLTKNGEVQDRVRTEIQEILADTNGKLEGLDKLKDLKLLDAVIKEALRMYPPQTTFIGRSGTVGLQHSFVWKGNEVKCTIPKDVHIQVGLYQIMNSDEFWDCPRTFQPERFMENATMEQKKMQNITFLPFGKGRRICIGRKYADIALKMTLISLLSKFRLRPCVTTNGSGIDEEEIEVVYKTATMTPKNGVFGKPEWSPLFDAD